MRVFDFDGTIYDGESLFDLYLYSARHDPKVFRYIAPVLRYAVKYKLGRATLEQMEYGVGKMTEGYLTELSDPNGWRASNSSWTISGTGTTRASSPGTSPNRMT